MSFVKKKIVVGLSGSISCFKACALVSKLVQENFEVQCVMTENATKFIGPVTLEALTKKSVLIDMFEESKLMSHIDLVKWADLFLVYPASASLINN